MCSQQPGSLASINGKSLLLRPLRFRIWSVYPFPGDLVKLHTPGQEAWGETGESALLTSSPVRWMLPEGGHTDLRGCPRSLSCISAWGDDRKRSATEDDQEKRRGVRSKQRERSPWPSAVSMYVVTLVWVPQKDPLGSSPRCLGMWPSVAMGSSKLWFRYKLWWGHTRVRLTLHLIQVASSWEEQKRHKDRHAQSGGEVKRHREKPCDNGGSGEWCIHQPRIPATGRSCVEAGRVLPEPSEGAGPWQQLDSGFWPPALGEHKSLLFEATWLVGLGYAALAANTPDSTRWREGHSHSRKSPGEQQEAWWPSRERCPAGCGRTSVAVAMKQSAPSSAGAWESHCGGGVLGDACWGKKSVPMVLLGAGLLAQAQRLVWKVRWRSTGLPLGCRIESPGAAVRIISAWVLSLSYVWLMGLGWGPRAHRLRKSLGLGRSQWPLLQTQPSPAGGPREQGPHAPLNASLRASPEQCWGGQSWKCRGWAGQPPAPTESTVQGPRHCARHVPAQSWLRCYPFVCLPPAPS